MEMTLEQRIKDLEVIVADLMLQAKPKQEVHYHYHYYNTYQYPYYNQPLQPYYVYPYIAPVKITWGGSTGGVQSDSTTYFVGNTSGARNY